MLLTCCGSLPCQCPTEEHLLGVDGHSIWAHCRRRFYELHQATGSPLADEVLRRIGELYAIEAELRGRPAEERLAARQERSKPVVDALHAWLTAQLARV
ncbi:MAG TPA: transposase, partial [Thermoleophilaceae bacterium]|nr:transposase [Thermoleophilaceae bacterium]